MKLLAALLAFQIIPFPGPGRAPAGGGGGTVTIDAQGVKRRYSSGTNYTDLTIGSGNALLVLLVFDGVVPTSPTVTWDSGASNQALSSCVNKDQTTGPIGSSQLWAVASPVSGNKTLVVSWTGGGNVFIYAVSLSGVAATPCTNSNTGSGVSTISITSQSGDLVFACESSGVGQGTSTGTQLYSDNVSGSHVNAMCQYDSGAATVNIGNTGSNTTLAGVSIAHN